MSFRYIAAGVKTDCQTLLQKFRAMKCVRFETFSQIWRESQFSCIFCGRDSFAELHEFIEEVLKIAKEFFLPPNNLQTRMFGLYLLYGFYYKQPTVEGGDYLVKIRINMKEWEDSCQFMSVIRKGEHYDALFIFNRLVVDSAFYFCLKSREYGLEKSMRKYLEKQASLLDDAIPRSELGQFESTRLLSRLDEVCTKYYRFKCALNQNAEQSSPDQLLNYTSPNIAEELRKVLEPLGHNSSDVHEVSKETEKRKEDDEVSIGERRRRLKLRACFTASPKKKTSTSHS